MDFSITEKQKNLREKIVGFAQRELNADVIARDNDQAFPRDLWRKCAEIGIQGFPAEEVHGGSDLDALSCAMGLEALGYGCHDGGLVFSICAHVLACVVPLSKH